MEKPIFNPAVAGRVWRFLNSNFGFVSDFVPLGGKISGFPSRRGLAGIKRCSAGSIALLVLLACCIPARAAVFTVNTVSDSHAVTPGTSALDGTGHISLRSAIEAANAQAGAATINVPAGGYNLNLGELSVAPNGGKTNAILGAGAAATLVTQTDSSNRVFNIDLNSLGGTAVTLAGLTIQGGHDGADKLGGAGILAGSITAANKDSLTLSNCVVQNNRCLTNTTQEPGGGIQMAGGDLTLINCAFTNNSSGQSFGGGVFMLAQSVVSLLTVSNCAFVNNSLTNNSGAGPDGGGALMIMTPAGSVHTVSGSTFIGNRVVGNSGNTYGGAIQMNGGALNITSSTFTGNAATGFGGLGGAIYLDSGTLNLSFCRLVGNSASSGASALYNHGSNGASTTAANNWWGCNGGPGAGGCDSALSDAGNLTFAPWLVISNTASLSTVSPGQAVALTASVLQNSSNQALTPAQVGVLLGLPIVWSGVNGTIFTLQTTIQGNGQATAILTTDGTCNTAFGNVTLDNATASAPVNILCPDLTLTKTNSVGGTVNLGNSWTWALHVANSGSSPAVFTNGQTVLLDNLPNTSIAYGSPVIANAVGITGTLTPAVDASTNLSVACSGAVTLAVGASFDALITATPLATGAFGNPRAGGICRVNPSGSPQESNSGNNTATDTVTVVCPTVTAAVSGSTTICPGGSAIVTVNVTGGAPPYTITLNNGGGTLVGGSPLFFTVSPPVATNYQVSSGTDAHSCPVSGSGSASISISSVPVPTLTLTPPSVLANSGGNQASGPGGFAAYAWTIFGGRIVGPANQPTVTYVAGASNNVTLALTVFNALGCSAANSISAPIITGFSVHTNVVFTDGLTSTTMGMAFDGSNYWSCSGGSTSGNRLARYSATGVLLGTFAPGLDFRSVFSRPDGTILARAFNTNVIYQQTSPGVFGLSGITLTGGTLNSQSAVVLNAAGNEFNAMNSGVVSRWSTNGSFIGTVNLAGYGSIANENVYPQNRGIVSLGNLWGTYSGSGTLFLWDSSGNRIAQVALPGAGTTSSSAFSFSYSNGKIFIVDNAGAAWRGFDIYSGAAVAVLAAESVSTYNTDVTAKIAGTGMIPRVDFLSATAGNPVPTSAKLRSYQSVMLFSDSGFTDNVGMGNALADYIDQGGGVVVQTFAFATNGGLGISGRALTGGYLPFTEGSYSSPGGLTLVKVLPSHPLLDGVTSFSGGTSSYLNTPIALASGATLVAQWNNGQPLVGAKDTPPGRCAGLNFFPPSSTARSDFWVASTDGARLMADALLWSGRIPPTLLSGPADQVQPLGSIATFSAVAVGTSPLSYQWRMNGTNLPAGTNSTLSFVVQPNSAGTYSVVVSNLYGSTTSLNASFNSQLRLLVPAISGGAFSLFLVNDDGTPISPDRASRVQLYSSTNVGLPFAYWTFLTNTVNPSLGQLRVDGFSTTNGPTMFFRATEAP